jgi:hypothetical protein
MNNFDLNIGDVPKEISDLTDIEIKVLSIILPHVSVVHTKYGKH